MSETVDSSATNLQGFAVLFLLSLCSSANATSPDSTKDLFDLSLQELLNITVSTASKAEKQLTHTPGTVTAFSQNDIRRMGYYTLTDLASITPGYWPATALTNTYFQTRGISDSLNSKHLLLIDGIPANHARDYMVFAQEQLPVFSARQVEFLRGPASALYGTGAFSGVINVKPVDLDSPGQESRLAMTYQSLDSARRIMGYHLSKEDQGRLRVAYGYYQKDASLDRIPVTDNLRNRYQDQQDSLYLETSYRQDAGMFAGLSIGFIHMAKEDGFGESWTEGVDTHPTNAQRRSISIPYLKFRKPISDTLWLNSYAKHNRSIEQGTQVNSLWGDPFQFSYRVVTLNAEYLAELHWQPDTMNTLVVGLNYDHRKQHAGDSFLFAPDDQEESDSGIYTEPATTSSLFAQYTGIAADWLAGLEVTLGARFDRGRINQNTYTHTSPRIAVVQQLTDNWGLKLLWGNALKAPGIKEIGHNQEKQVFLQSPDDMPNVEPETITTRELSLLYHRESLSMQLTYFDTTTQEQIFEGFLTPESYADPDNGAAGFFINRPGSTHATGIEWDLRASPTDHIWVFSNLTLTDTEDAQGQPLPDVPGIMANVGISLLQDRATWTLIARHADRFESGSEVPDYRGKTLLDATVHQELTGTLSLELAIRNLLDIQYFQPQAGSDGLPRPDRNVHMTLHITL